MKCSVKTCSTDLRAMPAGVSAHRVPRDPDRYAKWESAIKSGVELAGHKYSPYTAKKENRRVCSLHFLPEQLRKTHGKIQLVPDAVPSVFATRNGKIKLGIKSNNIPPVPAEKPPPKIQRKVFPDRIDRSCKAVQSASQDPLPTANRSSNYIPPVPVEKSPPKIQRKVFPDRIDRSCKAVQSASQDPLPTAKRIPPKLSECCRLCFSKDLLEPLCSGMVARDELLDKIYLCTGVLIVARPKESVYICTPCVNQIKVFFTYRQQICSNNRAVQQHLSKLNGPEKPPIASNPRKGPVTPKQTEGTCAGPSDDSIIRTCQDTIPMPRAVTTPMPRAVTTPMPRSVTTPMPRAVTTPMPRAVTTPMPKQVSNLIVPSIKKIFPPYITKKRKLDEDPQPPVAPEPVEEFTIDAPPKTEPFEDPLEVGEFPFINASYDDSSSTDSFGSGIDVESELSMAGDPPAPQPEASSAGKEDEQETWECWDCGESFPFQFECAKHALQAHRNSVRTIQTKLMLDELNTNMLEMISKMS